MSAREQLTHRALIAPAFLPGAEEETAEGAAKAEAPAAEEPKAARTEPVPAGEKLADLIVAGLRKRGWVIEYRWTTYRGHAFDARRGDHRYDVEVELQDKDAGGEGRWLITAKRRTGFFKKIFQGSIDPSEQEMLRRAIDETLAGDARTAGTAVWVEEAAWRG